jgi:hypothetical protein
MSDELRLPDDLAACEARLAAQSLPAAAINRDELMYRAGWAACEARLTGSSRGAVRLASGGGGIIAAWSLASAATAAALALALSLQWRPAGQLEVAAGKADARVQVSKDAVEAKPLSLAQREVELAALPASRPGIGIGLLSLRRQALNSAWEQPANVVTANGGGLPAAKTARELMQEMLPGEPVRSTRMWPWVSTPRGESI